MNHGTRAGTARYRRSLVLRYMYCFTVPCVLGHSILYYVHGTCSLVELLCVRRVCCVHGVWCKQAPCVHVP